MVREKIKVKTDGKSAVKYEKNSWINRCDSDCVYDDKLAFAPVNSAENTSATSDYSSSQNNGTTEGDYIIKAEKGYIVVYKKGEDKAYLTTDCRVSNLPKGDALYLEKGIEIKGKENLMRALEDYCS